MYGFSITDGRLTAPGHDYQPGDGVHVCATLAEYNAILVLANPTIVDGTIVDLPAPPVDPPPVVTEAQRLAAEHPDLPATVRAAFAALQSLVSMGVAIDLSAGLPPWRVIGPAIAARRREIGDLAVYRDLDAAADEADGCWRDVEYFCGSPQAAYRLAPTLAHIGV